MNKKQFFMGISALQGTSAAALIDDQGNIINFSREENRRNIRGAKDWPDSSRKWCVQDAQAQMEPLQSLDQINYGYYEYPFSKMFRRIWFNPRRTWQFVREAFQTKSELTFAYHLPYHKSHAWAGCATSPWNESYYLIIDSVGEWYSTTWGRFHERSGIAQLGGIRYPHSLGVLQSGFVRWLGLKPNEQEHLIIQASSMGTPKYSDTIREFIELKDDGTFRIKKPIHFGIEDHMGRMVPIDDWYDWCASLQAVLEETVLHLIQMIHKKYGKVRLVYGGSLANNAQINTAIMESGLVEDLWILPDPEKAGSALGAAAYAAAKTKLNWKTPYLGNDIEPGSSPSTQLLKEIARRLERGEVIGWIQGREEISPTNLAARCIMFDPTNTSAKSKLDRIIHNPLYNSYDALVIESDAWIHFDAPKMNPYKQFMARVRDPVRFSGYTNSMMMTRVQTVPKSTAPMRRLMDVWKSLSGISTLAFTDFRIDNGVLVSNRQTAIRYLLETENLDCITIGNHLYFRKFVPGLDDGQEWIIDHVDYSQGTDNMVQGRF